MALTSYSNWDTLQAFNSELSTYQDTAAELLHYSDDFTIPNSLLFEPHNLLYPEVLHLNLFLPWNSNPYETLHGETFPPDDHDLISCPKRQKYCYEHTGLLDVEPAFFDVLVPCSCPVSEDFPQLCPAMRGLEVVEHVVREGINVECAKMANNEKSSIMPQSVTARERRRKITERTQELGKLIPGGSKLNTAQMLNAASKYVKFLEAQVRIHEIITTTYQEHNASPSPIEELQVLIGSPSIQEKLYVEEKCLVPKDFISAVANCHDVQSRPSILKDLNRLMGSDS